jgi:hypothetical protein
LYSEARLGVKKQFSTTLAPKTSELKGIQSKRGRDWTKMSSVPVSAGHSELIRNVFTAEIVLW